MKFTLSDYRILRRTVFTGIACIVALAVCMTTDEPEYDAAGAARRPLVIISGSTQQIPTADYISSVGGVSTNATAAAAGDIQTTTLATGALNVGVLDTTNNSSAVDDWNPTGLQTASLIRVNNAPQSTISGITAPTGSVSGRKLCVQNTGVGTLSFLHESSSSVAANRFMLVGSLTWQLPGVVTGAPGQSVCFVYSATASRWLLIENYYLPRINVGSSSQFTVSTAGVIASTSMGLTGPGGVVATSNNVLGVTTPTTTFNTTTGALTSYGVNSAVASTRSSGGNDLTNVGGYFSATGAQVNNSLVADAGDVLLNKTSGAVKIGVTPQIISTGAPSANHGSLGTGSTNWVGNVTGVGAFSSVTLTFSAAFANRSWCFAQPNSVAIPQTIYVTNSASAPIFSCINTTTGAAANCNDFSYHCVGQ